ncbi:MAG TPA: low molecular weight phosphatase family protein [Alphaproteobacteria bacterium]|nr:low molecular weight phosphatase family protein [Alphaproteobacteria bacterium]
MGDLPSSILCACTYNAIRSPMAEGLLKFWLGRRVFIDSVCVREGDLDPFMVAVMEEMGIDMSRHRPKLFDDLEDTSFDLIISLAPEAQHRAVDLTRTMACDVEYWPTMDPTLVEGNREAQLDAYRQVRDTLYRRIRERFPQRPPPQL